MVNIHTLLHEEDDRILSGEFQFSDDIFELREKTIPNLGKKLSHTHGKNQ